MYKKAYGKINIILKVSKKQKNETKHKIDTAIQICKKFYDKIKKIMNKELPYLGEEAYKVALERDIKKIYKSKWNKRTNLSWK